MYDVQAETNGHISLRQDQRFDVVARDGKRMLCDIVTFSVVKGEIVEVTLNGKKYRSNGEVGGSVGRTDVAPPNNADLGVDYDVTFSELPVGLQSAIKEHAAFEVIGLAGARQRVENFLRGWFQIHPQASTVCAVGIDDEPEPRELLRDDLWMLLTATDPR